MGLSLWWTIAVLLAVGRPPAWSWWTWTEGAGAVAEAIMVLPGQETCQSDVDCQLSNGQCYNQSSRWNSPRCGCGVDHSWDDTVYFRCTPTTSITVVNRTSAPLYYQGQNRTFPLIWRCASKYCTATVGSKAQLGVLDANALVINGTHLDPARVGVRCLEGYRYAAVVDAPLEDRCVTCSVACAPHGTCASNVTKQCACASGWKGPDCRSVVSVTSSSWDAYEYLDTETYNALRPCTLHSDCGAYEKCFVRMAPTNQVGQGYCWCDAGRGPANSTSCGVVGMGVGVAAMGVDVFWATRFTWFVLLDDSRQLWYQPRNATETGGDFVGTAYTEMAALEEPDRFLITTQHLHAFYCVNESLYFWNTTQDPYGLPSRHCQGCSGMCGPYANCSAVAGASNATTGTCVCLSGYTGTFCDRQVPANTTCAAAECNAKGTCVLRQPWLDPPPAEDLPLCECLDNWSGSNCTTYDPACALDQCDGQGQCVIGTSYCNCTTPNVYGANCDLNATQCRTARCSDHGNCTTSLQGCTCDAYYTDYQCGTKECVGSGSVLNETSGECVCAFGRNGTHCENVICSGHGTYNASTLGCVCDTLYLPPRCATSQCGRNGTVILVSTNNVTRSVCDCATPYVADTTVNLTRCTLVCVRGTYNPLTEVCACGTLRYHGLRCELERAIPPDPRTSFDWAFQSLVVVMTSLLLLTLVDLFYLLPTQMHQPKVEFTTRVVPFDARDRQVLPSGLRPRSSLARILPL